MIKLPSVQGNYSLVWSGDPALELPSTETPEGTAERVRLLTMARDMGRWADITRSGELPTVFQCRRLPKEVFDYVMAERECSSEFNGRKLSDVETYNLFFRAALLSIDNLDGYKVKTIRVSKDSPVTLATHETVNAIGSAIDSEGSPIGAWIVGEIAQLVFAKETSGIRPLS